MFGLFEYQGYDLDRKPVLLRTSNNKLELGIYGSLDLETPNILDHMNLTTDSHEYDVITGWFILDLSEKMDLKEVYEVIEEKYKAQFKKNLNHFNS